jgi:nucleoside-diphosphate-sugar epimerase
MRDAAGATQMTSLQLGHFVGEGCSMSLVSAIVPRLKTRQVPWVDHGRAHLPLVSGEDMGEAFALAALADGLAPFESINIAGAEQPTAREVFTFVAETAGVPKPAYSVPLGAAHGFGSLMESVHPVTPGKAPFLTRALVHVGENWNVSTHLASTKLGFEARTDWRDAARDSIEERRAGGFAWPALAQAATCSVPAGSPMRVR